MNSKNVEKTTPRRPPEAVLLDVPLLEQYFLEWVLRHWRRILRPHLDNDNTLWDVLFRYLRPLTQCVIILVTHGQTPGTRLLGLERVPRRRQRNVRFGLWAYALVSTLLPVLHEAVKDWYRQRLRQRLASTNEPTGCQVDANDVSAVARERQFQTVHVLLQAIDRLWPLIKLTALVGTWAGVLGTSEVAMLLTGWTYREKQSTSRQLHVDYAHRRWLWEEMIRSVRVWGEGLTLLGIWQEDFRRFWKDYGMLLPCFSSSTSSPKQSTHTETACCFCQAKPVIIAVLLEPCGHTACYTCLYSRHHHQQQQQQQQAASRVRCGICKTGVDRAKRPGS